MDALLRAAMDRREREQGISLGAEFEQADEQRMRVLDQLAFPKCGGCGGSLNEGNLSGFCNRSAACRRLRRKSIRPPK